MKFSSTIGTCEKGDRFELIHIFWREAKEINTLITLQISSLSCESKRKDFGGGWAKKQRTKRAPVKSQTYSSTKPEKRI